MELTIGVIATVCSLIFGYAGYVKGQKDENKKLGNNEGILNTDIQYIKKRTDEVLLEQKDTNRNISAIGDRVTILEIRHEEGMKSANKRIDEIQGDFKDCKNSKVVK